MIRKYILLASLLATAAHSHAYAEERPEFSTAGFYEVDKDLREAIDFNIGWRFHKGAAAGAEAPGFDDSSWSVLNTPHGLELEPLDASGCVNYQGQAWYRKHFKLPEAFKGSRLFLHFEAIMGKSKVWVNGKLLAEHFGGYLPIHVDATDALVPGVTNIVAVWCDNSNDPDYPPGKPQEQLDFTYGGGIYRDVWLVRTGPVYFTNASEVDRVRGGGVFVRVDSLSENEARLAVDSVVRNAGSSDQAVRVRASLKTRDGATVATATIQKTIKQNGIGLVEQSMTVKTPHVWQPDDPYLYNLYLEIFDADGEPLDAMRLRSGLRTVDFRGNDGLWLNGKPYKDKLIGANRHQDFAFIGNALPNSIHWRDAKKLRDASLRIIRNAHYPQDPAFMDACDELGLFVIVNTPGWQFWNNKPIFGQRVYSDIRQMVRRDRNHASVLLWEPILNETRYPSSFARDAHDLVHEEYPYPGCFTACDIGARGQEYFDIVFAHPIQGDFWTREYPATDANYAKFLAARANEKRPVFTREWGDCVDDWNSHNSPSRAAVDWGERPQLVQALHYSGIAYIYTSYDALYHTPRQHFGGCLWHGFDHQRGYHPDPFWGGIMDAFRQPKYSYHLFRAQRDPALKIPNVESGPFVFVANEMTPFSDSDVWVFSNCDEVRLKLYGREIGSRSTREHAMPHAPVVFEGIFDFMDVKGLHRARKPRQATIEVEGLIDGKVVATTVKRPALRRSRIVLKADDCGVPLVADGSDIVPVVACFTDSDGRAKRLSDAFIRFAVEGAGELVDDGRIGANPQPVRWGRAVALVRASHRPGKINVTASVLRHGEHQPLDATLEIESVAATHRMLYGEVPQSSAATSASSVGGNPPGDDLEALRRQLRKVQKELGDMKIKEVERQQQEFESN